MITYTYNNYEKYDNYLEINYFLMKFIESIIVIRLMGFWGFGVLGVFLDGLFAILG